MGKSRQNRISLEPDRCWFLMIINGIFKLWMQSMQAFNSHYLTKLVQISKTLSLSVPCIQQAYFLVKTSTLGSQFKITQLRKCIIVSKPNTEEMQDVCSPHPLPQKQVQVVPKWCQSLPTLSSYSKQCKVTIPDHSQVETFSSNVWHKSRYWYLN